MIVTNNSGVVTVNGGVLNSIGTVYTIGQIYGGGVVFYTGLTELYICAEWDLSGTTSWGCRGTDITGTTASDGLQNTINIINICTSQNIAAEFCWNLNLSGYTDWYLPSPNDLTNMYNVVGFIPNLTILAGNYYWSSQQNTTLTAKALIFTNGSIANADKNSNVRVRPIRRVNL
jgi:hypothetical protein